MNFKFSRQFKVYVCEASVSSQSLSILSQPLKSVAKGLRDPLFHFNERNDGELTFQRKAKCRGQKLRDGCLSPRVGKIFPR